MGHLTRRGASRAVHQHHERFTADGEALVSGGRFDNHVNIYRRSGELVRTVTVGAERLRSPYLVALSPDGHSLVTADENIDPPGLGV